MWPALRPVRLGFAAGLLLIGVAANAQIRRDSRASKELRLSTSQVTIIVTPFDFDLATGEAVIPVLHAIRGDGYAYDPWVIRVHSNASFYQYWVGSTGKPCNDLEIRASSNFYFRPLAPVDRPVKWGGNTWGFIEFYFDLKLTARLADSAGEHHITLFFDLQR